MYIRNKLEEVESKLEFINSLVSNYNSTNDGDTVHIILKDYCRELFFEINNIINNDSNLLGTNFYNSQKSIIIRIESILSEDRKQEKNTFIPLIILLKILSNNISKLIPKIQFEIFHTVERMMIHLKWMIHVDSDYKQKWKNAFDMGETKCEQIGAIHFMLHGIFAYKVHAEKARTDLVYGETNFSSQIKSSKGVVITEWKKFVGNNFTEYNDLFITGVKQINQYYRGALTDKELSDHRYVIMLSESTMPEIDDYILKDVTYRCINIPCVRGSPSEEARKR